MVSKQPPKPAGDDELADIDGDGQADVAQLLVGWKTRWGWEGRLFVHLASGRCLGLVTDADVSYQHPQNLLLGHADVNQDGRSELVLWTAGNTGQSADIVTMHDGRLAVVTARFHNSLDGAYRESPVHFGGTGNSCGPWCDLTSSCRLVNGQPRLVTISGGLSRWYPRPQRTWRKRWTVVIYRMDGTSFIRTRTVHGSTRFRAPLPSRWPFINGLACGTAHWRLR